MALPQRQAIRGTSAAAKTIADTSDDEDDE